MQGSIANELYSGILQSSSTVELDNGLIATETDHNLQEPDSGDPWFDDVSSCEGSMEKSGKKSDMDIDREWQRRRNQFHTLGYRDGLIAGKEVAAQEGFNIGFGESVGIGYNWGLVRGITSAMACLPDGLKEKLVETEETRNKFQGLHESVKSLSTTDALRLFHEDQTKKLTNQSENAKPELNHQSADASILQNYYHQVESMIRDAPLVEAHLEINQ